MPSKIIELGLLLFFVIAFIMTIQLKVTASGNQSVWTSNEKRQIISLLKSIERNTRRR